MSDNIKLKEIVNRFRKLNLNTVVTKGKRPLEKGWNNPYTKLKDYDEAVAHAMDFDGAAFVINEEYIILDVDVKSEYFKRVYEKREDKKISELAFVLMPLYNIDENIIDSCGYIVQSPSGGYHLYFKKPEKYHGYNFYKNTIDFIDLQQKGATITLEGSLDNQYKGQKGSIEEVEELPEKIAKYLHSKQLNKRGEQVKENPDFDKIKLDNPENIIHAKKYLDNQPEPIEGSGSSNRLYIICCYIWQCRIGLEEAIKTLEHYNLIWGTNNGGLFSREELVNVYQNAQKYANKVYRGVKQNETPDNSEPPKIVLEHKGVSYKKNDALSSIIEYEHKREKGQSHVYCYKDMYFDVVSKDLVIRTPSKEFKGWDYSSVTEVDIQKIVASFGMSSGMRISARNALSHFIGVAAIEKEVNSLIEFFDLNLPEWDKKERCKKLFKEYVKVNDHSFPKLLEAYGEVFLNNIANRILNPGIKSDMIFILYGKEGLGKSTFLKTLAFKKEFFEDNYDGSMKNQKIIEQTKGRIIVEWQELRNLAAGNSKDRQKAEADLKAQVSSGTDVARMAYGTTTERQDRTFMLVGTTNDKNIIYSNGGNRRKYIVEFSEEVDFEKLKEDRDQLFAEAMYKIKNQQTENPRLFVGGKDDAELGGDMKDYQLSFASIDIIFEDFLGYFFFNSENVRQLKESGFTSNASIQAYLDNNIASYNKHEQCKESIRQSLFNLGFKTGRKYGLRGYLNDDEDESAKVPKGYKILKLQVDELNRENK